MSALRKAALWALACAAFVYGVAYVDLVLRARSAYLEGEKYLEWSAKPELKRAHFQARLAEKEARLNLEFERGSLGKEELEQRLYLARFERDQRVAESSLKYSYIWFQTAAELFSPPESRWVVLSRARMAQTREAWKRELDAKNIPHQDYMFE